MIGAIIGDIAGSTYEFHSIKTKDFPLFAPGSSYTDDSLMSIAVASALMQTGEGGDFKRDITLSMIQTLKLTSCLRTPSTKSCSLPTRSQNLVPHC